MRRFVNSLWSRATTNLRDIEREWDAFWYTPADPTLLGLIRILTGCMLIYTHAVWGAQLEEFFGPNSWLSKELVETMQRDQIAWSFWWYVPSHLLHAAHWTAMTILTLFTLGFATRLTAILSFVIVVSYIQRTPCALFGLDQINAFLTLYCAIGPSGAALSIDRWRKVRNDRQTAATPERSVGANLALRLIQVQMCVIYFFAGISKLQGPAWWNGDAMWLAFSNAEYQTLDMTWMVHHPWMIHLATHVTIAWEVTFWALVYRPMWRPWMLAAAVVLHVGIGACLGMWTFGLIMLVGCASFLPEPFVTALVSGISLAIHRLIPPLARTSDSASASSARAWPMSSASKSSSGESSPSSP